jgi:anti-sigma factor RsiW
VRIFSHHARVEVAMTNFLRAMRFRRDHRWAPDQMSPYLDGELRSRSRSRLERHTTECPECRGVLHTLRRMLQRLQHVAPVSSYEATPDIASAVRRRLREPSGA